MAAQLDCKGTLRKGFWFPDQRTDALLYQLRHWHLGREVPHRHPIGVHRSQNRGNE